MNNKKTIAIEIDLSKQEVVVIGSNKERYPLESMDMERLRTLLSDGALLTVYK